MKKKRYIILAGIAAAILLAVVLFFCLGGRSLPIEQNDFSGFHITATSFSPVGIAPDSGFVITTPHEYSAGEVKKMLAISPQVSFTVTETGPKAYLVTPNTPLALETTYTITLQGYKKAVTVKDVPFTVIGSNVNVRSTLPAKDASDVPLSSTIEFGFTVPMQDIRDHLVIEPEVKYNLRYVGNKVIMVLSDYATSDQLRPSTNYTVTLKKGAKGKFAGELAEDYSFSFKTGESYDRQPEIVLTNGYYYNDNARYETFLPDEPPVIDIRNNVYPTGKGYSEYSEYKQDKYKQIGFSIDVFALPSYNDYLYYLYEIRNTDSYASGHRQSSMLVDTESLSKVSSFNSNIDFTTEQIEQRRFASIVFPEPLPTGWYVANCTAYRPDGGELVLQKLIQVSPVTYYRQSGNGQSLLWFNDGTTGKAENERSITFMRNPTTGSQQNSYTTDSNGLVLFDLPPVPKDEPRFSYDGKEPNENSPLINDYSFYYILSGNNGILCDMVPSNSPATQNFTQDYYTYIYTDREIYRQTDELSFWGNINPRNDAIATVKNVTIKLCSDWDVNKIIEQQTIPVDEYGVFTGSFKFSDLASNHYVLYITPEDTQIKYPYIYFNKSVEVAQYKTPDYTFSSSTDKEFYGKNDVVKAVFDMSFFDGTPMSDVPLNFQVGYMGGKGELAPPKVLNTDGNGHVEAQIKVAEYTKPGSIYYSSQWRPVDMWINFYNNLAEDYELTANTTVQIFPHETMVTTKSTEKDGKADLVINTNKIDLSKLDKFEDWYKDDYKYIRGEPVAQNINIKVFHTFSEKIPVGTYIDPYTNLVTQQYNYEYHTEEILSLDKNTGTTGSITLEDLPACTQSDGYYANITVKLGNEQVLEEIQYLGEKYNFFDPYGKAYPYDSNQIGKSYSLQVKTSVDNTDQFYNPYYYSRENLFNDGDNIRVTLLENHKPVEMSKDCKLMLNLSQHKVLSSTITGDSINSFSLDESHLPNFTIMGAYFDGHRIFGIASTQMYLNPDSRSLNIDVEPDKQSYLPGESLAVKVTVRDKNGNPKPNTNICTSVINEAVFAVQEQEVNFPRDFFAEVYYGYSTISVSYRQRFTYPNFGDEGGKGGGGDPDTGGGIVRRNFSDSAGFATGNTDKNGVAIIKMTLPEGLTSWRITALGISKDRYVGNNKDQVVTTLPFFVKPIYNKVYLSGDNASLLLRSFGNEVKNGQQVHYQVKLDENEVFSGSGQVGLSTEAVLGLLPLGNHRLTVTGTCGDYSDGIEVDITVLDSVMETSLTKWFDLSGSVDLDAKKSPVHVTLYNEDYDTYLKAVGVVKSGFTGRADDQIAKKLIYKSLLDFYGEYLWLGQEYSEPLFINDYRSIYGKGQNIGIKPFPYSPPSIAMLARAAAVSPESFVGTYVEDEFYNYLCESVPMNSNLALTTGGYSSSDIAAAYMGLCATVKNLENQTINNYTLKEICDSIITSGIFDTRSKIYAVAAMSYIDKKQAEQLYEEIITPIIKQNGSQKYLAQSGENNAVSMTAAALIPAVLLNNQQDSDGFMLYIAEKQSSIYTRGDAALEAAMYVNSFVPRRTSAPVVSFTVDGKKQEVSLDKANQHTLTLSKESFEAAEFSLVSGKAKMMVDYSGSPEDNIALAQDTTMSRSIECRKDGRGGTTYVTYTIDFGPTAKYGTYKLIDWIPSNLRIRKYSLMQEYYCTLDMDNQLLTAYIDYSEISGRTITVTYQAQNVLESDAKLDNAYLVNVETMEGMWVIGGDTYTWSTR